MSVLYRGVVLLVIRSPQVCCERVTNGISFLRVTVFFMLLLKKPSPSAFIVIIVSSVLLYQNICHMNFRRIGMGWGKCGKTLIY